MAIARRSPLDGDDGGIKDGGIFQKGLVHRECVVTSVTNLYGGNSPTH